MGLLIFLKKKVESVIFFRKKSEIYLNIHDFFRKKNVNLEQILLIFLKKKVESVIFFRKKSEIYQNIHDFFKKKNLNLKKILLIFLKINKFFTKFTFFFSRKSI